MSISIKSTPAASTGGVESTPTTGGVHETQVTIPIPEEKTMTTAKLALRAHLSGAAQALAALEAAEAADKAARQAKRAARQARWLANLNIRAQESKSLAQAQKSKTYGLCKPNDGHYRPSRMSRAIGAPSPERAAARATRRAARAVLMAARAATAAVYGAARAAQAAARAEQVLDSRGDYLVQTVFFFDRPVVTDGPSCPLGSRPVGAAKAATVSGVGFSARVEAGQVVAGRICGRFASKACLEVLPEVQEAIVATAPREAVRLTGVGFEGTTTKSSTRRRVCVGGRGRSMVQKAIRMAESARARRESRDLRAAARAAVTAVSNAPRCALPVVTAAKASTPAVGAMYAVQAGPGRAAKPILRGYAVQAGPGRAIKPLVGAYSVQAGPGRGVKPLIGAYSVQAGPGRGVKPLVFVPPTWDEAHQGMTEQSWAALAARALSAKTPMPTVGMAVTRRRA